MVYNTKPMKTIHYLSLLIIVLINLGCSSEESKIINRFEGSYEIVEITSTTVESGTWLYYPDSVITVIETTIDTTIKTIRISLVPETMYSMVVEDLSNATSYIAEVVGENKNALVKSNLNTDYWGNTSQSSFNITVREDQITLNYLSSYLRPGSVIDRISRRSLTKGEGYRL